MTCFDRTGLTSSAACRVRCEKAVFLNPQIWLSGFRTGHLLTFVVQPKKYLNLLFTYFPNSRQFESCLLGTLWPWRNTWHDGTCLVWSKCSYTAQLRASLKFNTRIFEKLVLLRMELLSEWPPQKSCSCIIIKN